MFRSQSLRALTIAMLLTSSALPGCKRQPDLAQRVQDRIHARLPAATVQVKDAATLEVKVGENQVSVSLDNLATICKNDPDRCDETIDRLVQNLEQMDQLEKPAAVDELRAVLRSQQMVEETRKTIAQKSPPDKLADNQLVVFPFQADIMLVLVRDMPNGIAMLTHGTVAKMQLDENKARAISIGNLERSVRTLPTEVAAPGVFRVQANDSYEAARILVPKLWDALAKQVSGDLLVVAPTRDVVFATGSKDAAAVMSMNALARKAFDAGPYPLSTAVLRRTDTGFVLHSTSRP
jgi:uncharacterized protein YtpQ (UPF0354 family)